MHEFFVFIGMCFLGSFCITGLIEWFKSLRNAILAAIKKTGKVSTIAWPALSLVFACVMGVALGKMPQSRIFGNTWNAVIFASVLMLSFNETFGYKIILRLIFNLVNKVIDKTNSPALVQGYPVTLGTSQENTKAPPTTTTGMPYGAATVTGEA